MRTKAVTLLMTISLPAMASEATLPAEYLAGKAVANAFTVGTIYTFAVLRNGSGFCLPPEDRGVDVIWKLVEEDSGLFKDVKFEPNRLPEDAFLKLLGNLFPCR